MQIETKFIEKVSKLIFLEFKKESIANIFGISIEENIFLPLRPMRAFDKIKNNEKLEKIPISFFIEGIFYVLGGDENFRLNHVYLKLVTQKRIEAVQYIKGIIFDEVKNDSYEDAYILLKGLLCVQPNKENYDKLIMLLEHLRNSDNAYVEETLKMLSKAEKLEGYYKPTLDKAIIYYEQKKYEDAWFHISTYIEKSGDNSEEVVNLRNSILNIRHYEKGKSLLYEKPEEALQLLLPLLEEFSDDAILNLNIAIAYRILKEHETAIYYLNEAIAIDSAIVEVINELGINYAALEEYDNAIKYLRKAFEATKAIEICTNLIMCYLNKGDLENAKLHYDIAVKINPKDEIVMKLKKIIGD